MLRGGSPCGQGHTPATSVPAATNRGARSRRWWSPGRWTVGRRSPSRSATTRHTWRWSSTPKAGRCGCWTLPQPSSRGGSPRFRRSVPQPNPGPGSRGANRAPLLRWRRHRHGADGRRPPLARWHGGDDDFIRVCGRFPAADDEDGGDGQRAGRGSPLRVAVPRVHRCSGDTPRLGPGASELGQRDSPRDRAGKPLRLRERDTNMRAAAIDPGSSSGSSTPTSAGGSRRGSRGSSVRTASATGWRGQRPRLPPAWHRVRGRARRLPVPRPGARRSRAAQALVQAKATHTPQPKDARSVHPLRSALGR